MAVFPLEDFCAKPVSANPDLVPETNLEENRLEAYEQGYKAGWDDATDAQHKDQTRISADFARNLQALSFTYHEARSEVLTAIEPLLKEMVSKVLPKLASENLAQNIIDEVLNIARQHTQNDIEIVIAPANRISVEKLLSDQQGLEVSIAEEPSLAEGLALIRFGESEKQVDFASVLSRCSDSIGGFFAQQEKVVVNG
ncbi:MAG: flagellar biosynthesis protein [Rhodobacterales bacterium]|nr:MAG: flagellar biosynthesis protein [Rhodobacterales bacterium]